jgi:hypothetical protein
VPFRFHSVQDKKGHFIESLTDASCSVAHSTDSTVLLTSDKKPR